MKYLVLIALINLLLTFSAFGRNFQFNNQNDQLRAVSIVAGTYIIGSAIEKHFKVTKARAMLSSGILVGTAMYMFDYYDDDYHDIDKHKSQGMAIGIGMAWTLSLGFGF